ncbi:MAG TPA: MFS transporter [Pyrinomonadaceae bacterium]|jgi:MFS family permease|nr:MFS transporter [Pyrinomonadaceae bacterium]
MARSRFFYGWVIVAVATLVLVISNGLTIGGLPPFYKPMREEFVALGAIDPAGAESFIAYAANITFIMSGVSSLFGGWLLTRSRLRPVMLIGCVLLGTGLALHSQATNAASVYIARALMGSSLGFVGVAPCVVLVSGWFKERRGTALGIALTGTSLGGSMIALIAGPLIANFGWRTSMLVLSGLVWFVLVPVVWVFVREDDATVTAEVVVVKDGLTLRQALRTPLFWVFAAAAMLVFYPIFVILQQFILYVQTARIGVSAQNAALGQSALFAIGVGGKYLAGYLSDKFRAVSVMLFFAALMFASSLVLLDLTASNALLFLLPFAIGYGGTWVMLQRLASELFGRREIGKILGAITLVEVTGASIGGLITGYLADQHGGDYTAAFYGVTIAAGLALLTTAFIGRLSRSPYTQ